MFEYFITVGPTDIVGGNELSRCRAINLLTTVLLDNNKNYFLSCQVCLSVVEHSYRTRAVPLNPSAFRNNDIRSEGLVNGDQGA
jgi:hypothetical protein